jgi:hypothetical protein
MACLRADRGHEHVLATGLDARHLWLNPNVRTTRRGPLSASCATGRQTSIDHFVLLAHQALQAAFLYNQAK